MPKKKIKFNLYEPPEVKDKHEKLIPDLLTRNARVNLVGQSGSGKSQFMFNILFDWMLLYYKKSQATIVCMTGTKDTAVHLSKLAFKHKFDKNKFRVFNYFSIVELEAIYREHDGNKPLVLILDDCSFLKDFSSPQKKNLLTEIYSSGRHKNCSIMVSLQGYFHLSQDCRANNATHLVIYGVAKKEIGKLYEENFSLLMSEDEFKRIARKHLAKRYDFIVFDKQNKQLFYKDSKNNELALIPYKVEELY